MNHPFILLTECFVNENRIDITQQCEIDTISARELIKYNCFD